MNLLTKFFEDMSHREFTRILSNLEIRKSDTLLMYDRTGLIVKMEFHEVNGGNSYNEVREHKIVISIQDPDTSELEYFMNTLYGSSYDEIECYEDDWKKVHPAVVQVIQWKET